MTAYPPFDQRRERALVAARNVGGVMGENKARAGFSVARAVHPTFLPCPKDGEIASSMAMRMSISGVRFR